MSKKLGWLFLAVAVTVLPQVAFAQEESVFDGSEQGSTVNEAGIPLGAFLFSPTLELIYEGKDNIFLTDRDEVDDTVYVVRPRLMLELPVAENYFRVVYVPQWRDYADYEFDDNWSHFVDFQAMVDTPSGFSLKINDRMVRGVLETPEVDPGRELYYSEEPFFKNQIELMMGFAFTETDFVGADVSYTTVRYDEANDAFYDYDLLEAGLAYRRAMNPLASMVFTAGIAQNSVSHTAEFREYDGWYGRVGFEGELTPNMAGELRVGYESREFGRISDGSRPEYSGLTADMSLRYSFSDSSSFELEIGRAPYLSNYEENAFYTADRVAASFDFGIVGDLFGTVGASWHQNQYEEESEAIYGGDDREDDILRWGLGLGYHFTDWLSMRANWRYEERDSNLNWVSPSAPGFDYEANVFLVNLVVGY